MPDDETLAPQPIAWINCLRIENPRPLIRASVVSLVMTVLTVFVWLIIRQIDSGLQLMLADGLALVMVIASASLTLCALVQHQSWLATVAMLQESANDNADASLDRSVERILIEIGGLSCPNWDIRNGGAGALQHRLTSEGWPMAITIVDKALRPKLEAIPVSGDLVEAESADSRFAIVSKRFWISTILALVGTVLYSGMAIRSPHFERIFLAAACATMLFVQLARALGVRVFGCGAPVVGPGYIMNHQGNRRWTVDDSCVLLTRRTSMHRLVVEFVGPAGYLKATFENLDDPGFIALWQRWRHPNPRPNSPTNSEVRHYFPP